jgi:hypothetical protein
MSYDLTFVPKDDGQSWDEALDAATSHASVVAPDPEVWARILAGAQQVLGDVSVFQSGDHYELSHEPTGIQVSYYGLEAAVTVPYWYAGAEAETILMTIFKLGRVVEAATGFKGYDQQLDLSLAEAAGSAGHAIATFDRMEAFFTQLGR